MRYPQYCCKTRFVFQFVPIQLIPSATNKKNHLGAEGHIIENVEQNCCEVSCCVIIAWVAKSTDTTWLSS